MNNLIEWCNNNGGFLTAVLSIVGLLLSIIAILVSIRTARLPYKKKLMLEWSYLFYNVPSLNILNVVGGGSISLVNVGNRPVTIVFLGFAIKEGGKLNLVHGLSKNGSDYSLVSPSSMITINIGGKDILNAFSGIPKERILYVYAKDTEGQKYKHKIGTVEKLLRTLNE